MTDSKADSFETKMNQLETLVGQLESGDLSLDDAMKTFEQGIKLTRECQAALDDAEQTVQVLLGPPGNEKLSALKDTE